MKTEDGDDLKWSSHHNVRFYFRLITRVENWSLYSSRSAERQRRTQRSTGKFILGSFQEPCVGCFYFGLIPGVKSGCFYYRLIPGVRVPQKSRTTTKQTVPDNIETNTHRANRSKVKALMSIGVLTGVSA